MGLRDYEGEPVLGGTWLYSGVTPKRVLIIARDYDIDYVGRQDDRRYDVNDPGEDDGDRPVPAGPDGRLYYVSSTDSPALPTLAAAKAWADSQPWGPITWDE